MKPGEKLGPFDIEKKIGSGAMGAVYRGRYRKTGQKVAVKVMIAGSIGNETAMARFQREAEILKQLNHRNIVRFYIASQYQGAPYYAMEYIEGEPLDHVMQRRGRLTWEETVELGKQVCAALQHAHDAGILHRDLKPSNLMIAPDGTVKLTDFGIAKDLDVTQLTSANSTVGTAAYMSPEQCKGERNLTHKADLYSLGVVLYELITGQKPFQAETTMDMFLQHVQGEFVRPARLVLDVPVWLDTLICQMLEKKPEHRPFDAAMVGKVLGQIAEKVAAQQSAGVDAAKTRRADRGSASHGVVDEQDKKVARSLMAGMKIRKAKKKRRQKPFFERAWFQGSVLAMFLAGIVFFIIKVFQPATPEQLLRQIESRMNAAKDFDAKLEVRDPGPIKMYLDLYGARDNEETRRVRRLADDLDVDNRWRALKKKGMAGENQQLSNWAAEAQKAEQAGDWEKSEKLWQKLSVPETKDDDDARIWGLVAAWRLQELAAAKSEDDALSVKLQERFQAAVPSESASEPEQHALDALLYEQFKDLPSAQKAWSQFQSKDPGDRSMEKWALLAKKHLRGIKVPDDADEQLAMKTQAIKNVLAFAQKDRSKSESLYHEIVRLYGKDSDPDVHKLVERAQTALAALTSP
jgi:serine/threonine-protein kinase